MNLRVNKHQSSIRSLTRDRRAYAWPNVAVLAFVLGAVLLEQPAQAQVAYETRRDTTPPAQPAVPALPPIQLDTVQAELRDLEANTNLDEAVKTTALEQYKAAVTALQEADTLVQRADAFTTQLQQAPSDLEAIKAALAQPTPPVEAPKDLKLAESEQELAKAEAELKAAKDAEQRAEDELKRPTLFVVEGPKQISAAKKELEQVNADLAAKGATPATDPAARAQQVRLLARRVLLEAKIKALEAELLYFNSARELIVVRHDKAIRDSTQKQRLVDAWRAVVTNQRQAEAEKAKAQAEQARATTLTRNPRLEDLLKRNADLATEQAELAPKVQDLTTRQKTIETKLAEISEKQKNVTAQAEAAQYSNAVGVLMRNERSQLPDLRKYQREKQQRRSEISERQVRIFELQNERAKLRDLEAQTRLIVRATDSSASELERERIAAEAQTALQDRSDRLLKLWTEYGDYLKKLVDLDVAQGQLIDKIEAFRDFLDKNILWTRSGRPISVSMLGESESAVLWYYQANTLPAMFKQLQDTARSHLATAGPGLLAVLALLLLKRRLRRVLESIAERSTKPIHTSFSDTMYALLDTFLLAIPWPMLLILIGWRLLNLPNPSDWTRSQATGLIDTGLVLFPLLFVFQVCRKNGLAIAHFDWPSNAAQIIRTNLAWLMVIGLPLVFMATGLESQADEARKESLGRLAFMVLMLALTVFFYRLLRRRGGIFQEVLAMYPQGWLSRLRFLWQFAVIIAPVGLLVAAAMGYYYTAFQLVARLYWTLAILVAAVFVHALLLRWLLMARRHLAIAQAKERQAQKLAELKAAGKESEGVVAEAAPPVTVDLSAVSQQSRQILNTVVAPTLVFGLWLIWSATLPALEVLHTVTIFDGVTLAQLGLGILVTILTTIALRNLPGLLEMLLLQHLPLDSSTRYACTAISRYLITVTGAVLVLFGIFEVEWNSVQWLVAAVTVGLGFGLQEIFANFVSGLILLFERPIRIGDTVTVGNVTGSVSRIRARATIITDWDRKELIIPNKEFVTGQVVNWSLSDQILRLIVKVGIAYGSDTKLAREVLLKVAKDNQQVLDMPKAQAWFVGFGDSTLDFELRVFTRNLDDWMLVRNALHMEIDQSFRKAGIEIAFPQRDLHLRSVDPQIRFDPASEVRQQPAGADGSDRAS